MAQGSWGEAAFCGFRTDCTTKSAELSLVSRELPALASALPDLVIVVDHLAKPPIGSGDLSSGKVDLRAATKMAEHLATEIFPDLTVGLVHGRLSADERDDVMRGDVERDPE